MNNEGDLNYLIKKGGKTMQRHMIICLLTFSLVLGVASFTRAVENNFTFNFPGAKITQAEGINNAGQIVGGYWDGSGGSKEGCSFTPKKHSSYH